jgi:hypothetical protein
MFPTKSSSIVFVCLFGAHNFLLLGWLLHCLSLFCQSSCYCCLLDKANTALYNSEWQSLSNDNYALLLPGTADPSRDIVLPRMVIFHAIILGKGRVHLLPV